MSAAEVEARHEPELRAPIRPPWTTWGMELLVGAAALALVNYILAPEDPGLLRVSPHPLYLLPALLAVRYGFGPGAAAGLLAAGLHAYAQRRLGADLSYQEPILLALTGLVLGELRQRQLMKEAHHRRAAQEAAETTLALREQLEVEREARAYLERRIVEPSRSVTMLYEAAQRLETLEASALPAAVLELLVTHLDVEQAGLIEQTPADGPDAGRLLTRAVHGAERSAAEGWVQDPLVRRVLERGEGLSVRDLPAAERRPDGVVLAAPLLSSREEVLGALVVRSMPFVRLTHHAARTLGMLGSWAGRALERIRYVNRIRESVVIDEERGVLRHTYFAARLREEFGRARRYGYPLAVVALTIERTADIPPTARDRTLLAVATTLTSVLRNVDQVFCHPEGQVFMMSLPHTPPTGAERARERILSQLERLGLEPYREEGRRLEVAIGLSCFEPGREVEAEDLAEEAIAAAEEEAGALDFLRRETLRRSGPLDKDLPSAAAPPEESSAEAEAALPGEPGGFSEVSDVPEEPSAEAEAALPGEAGEELGLPGEAGEELGLPGEAGEELGLPGEAGAAEESGQDAKGPAEAGEDAAGAGAAQEAAEGDAVQETAAGGAGDASASAAGDGAEDEAAADEGPEQGST